MSYFSFSSKTHSDLRSACATQRDRSGLITSRCCQYANLLCFLFFFNKTFWHYFYAKVQFCIKPSRNNLEQLEMLNDEGGAWLKHYQWSCLLTDLLPGSEPISSAGYYLLFMLYITKIVLLIYHLYCCIVSIIYSDHAEIPGKLSNKENGIECVCIQRYLLCF